MLLHFKKYFLIQKDSCNFQVISGGVSVSDFGLWILVLGSLGISCLGLFIFCYNHPIFVSVKGRRKNRKMKEKRQGGRVLMWLGSISVLIITITIVFF